MLSTPISYKFSNYVSRRVNEGVCVKHRHPLQCWRYPWYYNIYLWYCGCDCMLTIPSVSQLVKWGRFVNSEIFNLCRINKRIFVFRTFEINLYRFLFKCPIHECFILSLAGYTLRIHESSLLIEFRHWRNLVKCSYPPQYHKYLRSVRSCNTMDIVNIAENDLFYPDFFILRDLILIQQS